MPTTRAASAPSRRAIRKEEIKRQVPVANQLQVTKSSLVPPNHTVKAFAAALLFLGSYNMRSCLRLESAVGSPQLGLAEWGLAESAAAERGLGESGSASWRHLFHFCLSLPGHSRRAPRATGIRA